MANFTGMTVQVTLKDPPNLILHGQVKEVIAGQTLTLQNVLVPSTGAQVKTHTVPVTAIADLHVIAATTAETPLPTAQNPPRGPSITATSHYGTATPPVHQQSIPHRPSVEQTQPEQQRQQQQQSQTSSFVDPAILSYAKSPAPRADSGRQNVPPQSQTPSKSTSARAAGNLPSNSAQSVREAKKSSETRHTALNEESFQAFPSEEQIGVQDIDQEGTVKKKRARKTVKKQPSSGAPHDPPPVMNADVSRNGNDMDGSVKRGKGWRQTPLLQPSQNSNLLSPEPTSKRRNKHERRHEADQNGWATEDATDVQELGDFDFEANHKLFDKKQVFDQLRQGDTTADEDRLVSHNKIHRPGTYGGKNLHPTENVLSPPLGPNAQGDTSSRDADTELNLANGRSSSRHSASRAPAKRQPSRQSSTHVDVRPHPLASSMSSERGLRISPSMTSLTGKGSSKVISSVATQSPLPDRTSSPLSALPTGKVPTATPNHAGIAEPFLAIQPTSVPCPVLLPAGLETLEQETTSRYGLTQEAITENAARTIAETAMSLFDGAGEFRRPSRTNTIRGSVASGMNADPNSNPVVVIIAGNHATGARAIAAARHLVHRKVSIIVAEGPYDSPELQDSQARLQISMLKRLQKSGLPIKRGSWRKASQYIKSLSGPPAIIIDALLAGAPYDPHEGAEIREMIDWANRSRAPVLSLACPSGIYAVDGSATTVEGEPLAVRPDAVLCLGAPVRGLLLAMKGGEPWNDVRLADIGINLALRAEDAVPFGSSWVVRLGLADGEMDVANAA